jgi:hypothetical protein
MTTSVEATVHLDVADALAANPAGIALVIFAILLLVLRPKSIRVSITLAGATLALMWIFELQRFGFF